MDLASRVALATALAGAAFALGAVHSITLCLVAVLLAAAACLAWWDSEPFNPRNAATLLLLCCVGLILYTGLQCLPMPVRWLATIAPRNADVWSRALTPLHEVGPSWAPITLDPIATHVELLKGVAYLLAYLAALRITRTRSGVAFLVATVVLTGVALAVAALLHSIFGATRVFGVYAPMAGGVNYHIAPLLNPNHLAAYLNISFCLALGAWLSPHQGTPRPLVAALIVFLVATQVWVASRAGVLTMVLAGVIVVVIFRTSRPEKKRPTTWISVVAGTGMLIGVMMLVIVGFDRARAELADTGLSKFSNVAWALQMVPTYGLFGVGRGAFETTYPQFRVGVGYVTATHPENIIAQWVTEWGVPVAAAAFVAILFALRPTVALARQSSATGAWAALVGAAIHNMADFNSEIPGVMLALTVSAAVVVGGSSGRRPRWPVELWSHRSRLVAVVGLATAVVTIALVASNLRQSVVDDRRNLHDAIVARLPMSAFHNLARSAMLRHPAEPYLPFAAGLRASQAGDENPLPWLGATLERARVYGPAHLVLAQLLAARSPGQARLEYRLAIEEAPELEPVVEQQVPRLVNSYDDAMEVVPPGPSGIPLLTMLVGAVTPRLPATAVRLDAELAAKEPDAMEPHRRAAMDALQDLTSGDAAPWCQGSFRSMCIDSALAHTTKLQSLSPGTCVAHALRARILVAAGETKQALDGLEQVSENDDGLSCTQDLFLVAHDAGDVPRALAALGRLARVSREVNADWVQNLTFVAHWQEAYGDASQALVTYKKAYERAPEDDELLIQIARLSSSAGLHAEALADYESLARHQPNDSRWLQAAQAERSAFTKGF